MKDTYVVIALFEFSEGPVFNELVGVKDQARDAFDMLEAYDYKKVIASTYEMQIEEVRKPRKDFGLTSETKKMFYEERRYFCYQVDGENKKFPVTVTFTIYQA